MGGQGHALFDQSRVVENHTFSRDRYHPVIKLLHDFIESGFAVPERIFHAIQLSG